MFDTSSRYYQIETATLSTTDAEGKPRLLVYKRRRLIPAREDATLLAEHTVSEGERLDTITARYLNDPTQYWQLCDANGAMRPSELVQEIGRVLHIVAALK